MKDYIEVNLGTSKYSPKLLSLMKKMLNPDPEKRITIDEIMKKKFVK